MQLFETQINKLLIVFKINFMPRKMTNKFGGSVTGLQLQE